MQDEENGTHRLAFLRGGDHGADGRHERNCQRIRRDGYRQCCQNGAPIHAQICEPAHTQLTGDYDADDNHQRPGEKKSQADGDDAQNLAGDQAGG